MKTASRLRGGRHRRLPTAGGGARPDRGGAPACAGAAGRPVRARTASCSAACSASRCSPGTRRSARSIIAFQKYTSGRSRSGSAPTTSPASSTTRCSRTAWRNTLDFTRLALLIGFAVPFVMAIVLNELRHAKAFFRVVVYLPVMIPPVVSALLWKWFYDPGAGLFNEVLALPAPAHLELVQRRRHRDDLAGPRRHLGQHGRHHPHLPGRAAEHPRRAVRGGRAGRRQHLAARPACDDPADPLHHAGAAAAADHRHDAGLHRAVRAHRRRPGELDRHGPGT